MLPRHGMKQNYETIREEMDRVRSNLSGLDWEEGGGKDFVYPPREVWYTRREGSCCRVSFSL